jgi:hypothetical protein
MVHGMQEFSSISVSSYEAESLSDRLTEQSAAGWSVVAVVPAGSQVVAYLSREANGDESQSSFADTTVISDAVAHDEPAFAESAVAESVGDGAVVADPVTEAPGWATTAVADPQPAAVTPEPTPEPTPVVAAATTAATTPAAAPAGWYADPSARYDLRYWDGSEWTEHVSRNGQQATDPPVA